MAKYDYRGSIHVHSSYSDGTGSIAEIAAAANEAGVDFLVITDHDTLKAREEGEEGWKESALVIVGAEITPPKNHYLVFGEGKLKGVNKLREQPAQKMIDEVKKQSWLGFMAHPDHTGTKRFDIPPYPWEDWDVEGFTGLGIWDLMTDWEALLDRDDVTFDIYENFANYLTGPKTETLKKWDELNAKRRVVGIGEVDNHRAEREYEGNKLYVFPYDWAFRSVSNHILLDKPLDRDPDKARAQVLEALAAGHVYVSLDFFADPTEFDFEIDDGQKSAGMGDDFELTDPAELIVTLPEEGLINVVRDGVSIHEHQGDELILTVEEPGVYRVEVLRENVPWIFSNPIRVSGEVRPDEP